VCSSDLPAPLVTRVQVKDGRARGDASLGVVRDLVHRDGQVRRTRLVEHLAGERRVHDERWVRRPRVRRKLTHRHDRPCEASTISASYE
jgi:hypothetical protein